MMFALIKVQTSHNHLINALTMYTLSLFSSFYGIISELLMFKANISPE